MPCLQKTGFKTIADLVEHMNTSGYPTVSHPGGSFTTLRPISEGHRPVALASGDALVSYFNTTVKELEYMRCG